MRPVRRLPVRREIAGKQVRGNPSAPTAIRGRRMDMGTLTHLEMSLVELDLLYQMEMESSPAGRKACELLREAQDLELEAQFAEALALRQRAVALFSDDDDGAAASSARHDLAHSLTPNPRHGLLKG